MNFADYNAGDILWLGDWGAPWIALLLVLGVLVIGVSYYDLRSLPARRCWTLVILRAAVFCAAVALLLEPAIDLKNVTKVKNQVAILVDASRSMSLPTNDGDSTRIARAADALAALDIPQTGSDDDHVYEVFTFGEDLAPFNGEPTSLKAEQTRSDLSSALKTVRKQYERKDVGGIVVISDGIDSGAIGNRVRRGEDLDQTTIDGLQKFEAPVNTVIAASDKDVRDIAVVRVARDDFAFVHNKVSIEVEVQVVGVKAKELDVSLGRDGRLLQTRTLKMREGVSRYNATFEFVPKQIGKEVYSVSLPHLEDEALYDNNTVFFVQKVIRDKVRALQVVGRPSWDERFLRSLLKRNPNVDLISFFILRTNQNVHVAPTSELSLIPFPTDELFQQELGSFDLVFFQNFDFGPYNMRQYLSEIAQFVKKGGGFVMIGGDLSFASGGYAQTPIEEILPIELPAGSGQLIDEQRFKPKLTDAGTRHPITALAFDPAANREIWSELPDQRGTNIVLKARDNATVLAEHPNLTFGGKKMPVVTISEVGEGRAMAITTDSTWRWAFERVGQGGTAREYQLFWNNAIRWLIKDPELKLLRVEVAEDGYDVGQVAKISARVVNPDYTDAPNVSVRLSVSQRGFSAVGEMQPAPRELEKVTKTTNSQGLAEFTVPLKVAGVYKIQAEATTAAGELKDTDTFIAVNALHEFRDIVPRTKLMKQLSEQTEGAYVEATDVSMSDLKLNPPRTVQVNRRTVIHIWDTFIVFLIILGLLTTEWILRRRWGRL